jgi:hypothetical protein
MQDKLSEQQVDILVGDPAVNGEFSSKVQELNRRLRKNNLDYQMWDGMNDRQHEIFSDNLFLNGECAGSVKDYVHGAVESCGPPPLPSLDVKDRSHAE